MTERILLLTCLLLFAMSGFSQTPDAPTGLVATAGVERALVTFTVPANDGGSAIINYEYSTDNGVSWTSQNPASTLASIVIPGLTNCTAYSIKLRAVNSVGAGTASSAVSVTPGFGTTSGITWTTRSSAADNNWQNVTYGNGLFVAVAYSGMGNRVMTSPDGINWTIRTSAADNNWTCVTYGNGLFVAVANTGTGQRVMTSPDGITWTIRTTAADNQWQSVTYGNGLFVAVAQSGTGNRVMTSPDGIAWTICNSAADNQWQSVTFGNGLFVAVANSGTGNRVMTSTDGITWTTRSSAADISWRCVTYGNGMFVATAQSGTGNRVMTSTNGINWTIRTSAADNNWLSVTYGNGLFVAVANGGTNSVMTSPDGIAWTPRNQSVGNSWQGVTYGNGLFVAVANAGTGTRVMTSFDALADKPLISSITPAGDYITVAFTVPANPGTSAISNYEYSIDNGFTWATPTPATASSPLIITGLTTFTTYQVQLRAVNTQGSGCATATTNTTTIGITNPDAPTGLVATAGIERALVTFTAPANDGGTFITNYEYSIDDGTNWTALNPASTPASMVILGLTNCIDYSIKLRAVNSLGAGTASSAVPVTPRSGTANIYWISRTSAANNSWRSITYGNGLFVAVANSGTGNRLMTSPDAITWTARAPAADNNWNGITYGNGLFVAVANSGSGNRVMTSPDGITWTIRSSAADNDWRSVTYGNGLFVAVSSSGTTNRVMTSLDGINWIIRIAASNNNWRSVTYGNGLFVAVANTGTGNRVMTSPDGITWTTGSSAAANSWQSVTYGNGLFVAVANSGTGNRVMTSQDGITWTTRNSAADNTWTSVSYGNGLFVAVAASGTGNRVMTSPDGINWTIRSSAADNDWQSVTYGNGQFVAVATTGTGNRVMTSFDALVPEKPAITSITPDINEATMAFTAGNAGYSVISNFEYSVDNGSNWVARAPESTASPLSITGLTPVTSYQVQLRAVNAQGSGCASDAVNTTTINDPPTITSFTPTTGCAGSAGITIAGTCFTGATAVSIGGTPVTSFTVNSDTEVTAIIGGGTTGIVQITTPFGTATSSGTFSVNPVPTWYLDADNDTYSTGGGITQCDSPGAGYKSTGLTAGGDCNDASSSVNPGVVSDECNGVDNDCDGITDEDATFSNYYLDGDSDGFGSSIATAVSSCSAIIGSVTNNSDCNDNIAGIKPGVTEICNNIDDDCNSLTDDGLIFTTYYTDSDVDGYGAGSGTSLCSNPGAGFSAVAGDCNDAGNSINPGVASDLCNGVDNDCDGTVDEDALTTNTTMVLACDSYTWSLNGSTYTQSGSYTTLIGCVTEVLVLTLEKLQFITQPSTISQKTTAGINLPAYTVAVDGGNGLVFQWYSNTIQSNSGGVLISGAQTTTYQPSTQVLGLLFYYCKATSSNGCQVFSKPSGMVQVCGNE